MSATDVGSDMATEAGRISVVPSVAGMHTAGRARRSGAWSSAERRREGRRRRAKASGSEPEEGSTSTEFDETQFAPGIVEHVRMVASLIEGFEVSRKEVVAMLEKTRRQRSILRESRRDYVVRWLSEHSP